MSKNHVSRASASPLLLGLFLAVAGSPAHAIPIATQSVYSQAASDSYSVSTSNDLILTSTPTLVGFTSYDGNPISDLTNGSQSARVLDLDGFTATYSLGSNALGYDLTSIVSTASAGDYRGRQEYKVYYSLAADPTTFIQLLSPYTTSDRDPGTFQTIPGPGTAPGDLEGNNATTLLNINITGLDNVADLEVSFSGAPSGNPANGGSSLLFLGAYGTASSPISVPEPSTWAMLLGGLALCLSLRGLSRRQV